MITKTTSSEKFLEKNDYSNYLKIKIGTELELEFLDGEPEDANLSRDFSDCYRIVEALELAHRAGTKGEKLDVTTIEIDDWI